MSEYIRGSVGRERKKLDNYAAMDAFRHFLNRIIDSADRFDIISAAERRCYNIVSCLLPNLNVVSNNALLLMYKDFAKAYMETGSLPKTLLCDDLSIHGRGMSKFLYQFENLIIDELVLNKCLNTSDDILHFHMLFTESITIFIYAQSAAPLLFSERFLSRIQSEKVLYPGRLRDLSMQLSDYLGRLDTANTAFSYSCRSSQLANEITQYRKRHEEQCECLDEDWKFIAWNYKDEQMFLFVRLYGKDRIERVSTVRYFPERAYKEEPLITSYSLIGNITVDTLDRVCDSCADVLPECRHLAVVLREKHKALLSARTQLVSTLLSILDFDDFYKSTFASSCELSEDSLTGDLHKIARNYGNQEQIFDELRLFACSETLRAKVRKVFSEALYGNVAALFDCTIQTENAVTLTKEECERINDIVASEIYAIGSDAEMEAVKYNNNIAQFHIEDYQSIVSITPKEYNDGVATLPLFTDHVISKLKDSDIPLCIYCYIASFIAMMDHGVMGMRLAATQYCEPEQVLPVMKAGEMATFYIPKKYALFIPAFAEVEEGCLGSSAVLEEKVISFIDRVLRRFTDYTDLLDPLPTHYKERINNIVDELFHDPKEGYKKDIETLYRCGQSFRGWNFSNLTHQDNLMLNYFQQKLVVFVQKLH